MTASANSSGGLLPVVQACPICGEQPKWRGTRSDYARGIYRLQCLGETHLIQSYGPDEAKCIVAWNTRASTPTALTSAEDVALREALARIVHRHHPVFDGDLSDNRSAERTADEILALIPRASDEVLADAGGALLAEAASLIYRIEAAGLAEYEATNFDRWKSTARELGPRLRLALSTPESPAAGKVVDDAE